MSILTCFHLSTFRDLGFSNHVKTFLLTFTQFLFIHVQRDPDPVPTLFIHRLIKTLLTEKNL